MAQNGKKMECVSEQQLKEAVESGMDYVRISFPDGKEPIYLVFNERPTKQEISYFLETNMLEYNNFTITGRELKIEKEV